MSRTTFFARLLGVWIVAVELGMAVNRAATIDVLNRFFLDPALMWISGVFTLLLGVVIVTLHNRWSGGLVPVIITSYGWIAAVKGALFVWLPSSAQLSFYQSLHFERFYYAYVGIGLILGAILVHGGFITPAVSRNAVSDGPAI